MSTIRELEPERQRLTYTYLARTLAFTEGPGEYGPASALMAETAQAVIDGRARDAATLAMHIEAAARRVGLTIELARCSELVSFFEALMRLEYGPYADGYDVQQPHPDEVLMVPMHRAVP